MQVALGILKRLGYTNIVTAMDGQQAMDKIEQAGGADAFDVVLTDLHMPHKVGIKQSAHSPLVAAACP